MSLGGSLFIRDAIRLDYCVEAAIESLVPVCDEIVVLDCSSTDGTLDILRPLAARHPSVRLVEGVSWEVAADYRRLPILANTARDLLGTDWHFMLQADEVLHESSYPWIREAIATWGESGRSTTFRVRRLNLFGDLDRHIRFEMAQKPCSDAPVRLGLRIVPAIGDAESLATDENGGSLVGSVTIFHYGFVRRNPVNLAKAIEMQSWFFGKEGRVDGRLLAMREAGGEFHYHRLIGDHDLTPIPMSHPEAARRWVEEHRKGGS